MKAKQKTFKPQNQAILKNSNFLNSQNYIKDKKSKFYFSINNTFKTIALLFLFFTLIVLMILPFYLFKLNINSGNLTFYLTFGSIFFIIFGYIFFVKIINRLIFGKYFQVFYLYPHSILKSKYDKIVKLEIYDVIDFYNPHSGKYGKFFSNQEEEIKTFLKNNFFIKLK